MDTSIATLAPFPHTSEGDGNFGDDSLSSVASSGDLDEAHMTVTLEESRVLDALAQDTSASPEDPLHSTIDAGDDDEPIDFD